MAEGSRFRNERARTFPVESGMMEPVRKMLQDVGIDRAFAPGRQAPQWLATAYEKLVPRRRVSRGREREKREPEVQEEYRWVK